MIAAPSANLLITGRQLALLDRHAVTRYCEHRGCRVFFNPNPGSMDAEAIGPINAHDPLHGILVYSSSDRIDRRVLEACTALRVVSRHGVGVENIDTTAAAARGVAVRTTAGLDDHEAVADLAWGLLLATVRRIVPLDRDLRQGEWTRPLTSGVFGKTLGIVGLGRIGRAVARRATGFSMRVLAYDPGVTLASAGQVHATPVELGELLATSAAVSLHCPLTATNRGLIGAAELAQMRPEAVLINTARAELVDAAALRAALETGAIAGAGIDVYPVEPPVKDPLVRSGLSNLVLTPHVGAYTRDVMQRMDTLALDNALDVIGGIVGRSGDVHHLDLDRARPTLTPDL